jgi:hypothetical protein
MRRVARFVPVLHLPLSTVAAIGCAASAPSLRAPVRDAHVTPVASTQREAVAFGSSLNQYERSLIQTMRMPAFELAEWRRPIGMLEHSCARSAGRRQK